MVSTHGFQPCNRGSNPRRVTLYADVAERSNAPDCKSGDLVSTVVQIHPSAPSGAGIAQLVEHFHGKEGVAGSSPASSSVIWSCNLYSRFYWRSGYVCKKR